MDNGELVCAREGCENVYRPKTHNQKYCEPNCCRIETNRRIMVNYYESKARRNGETRLCAVCQKTKLSRYNKTYTCGGCALRAEEESKAKVMNMLLAATA